MIWLSWLPILARPSLMITVQFFINKLDWLENEMDIILSEKF